MKETFQIYLNSRDAITGSTNPNICEFDLSAIVPNINTDRCRVRVSYFDVAVTAATWTTADVSSILITIPSHMGLYSYQSTPSGDQGSGVSFIKLSPIVGIFATGNTGNVANINSANFQYVPIGNIFSGILKIELVDQRRRSLVSDLNSVDKSWSLILDVEIDHDCD